MGRGLLQAGDPQFVSNEPVHHSHEKEDVVAQAAMEIKDLLDRW